MPSFAFNRKTLDFLAFTVQTFVVNLDYVKGVRGNSLIMKNGASLPITRRTLTEVKERYLQYFFRG